MARISHFLFPLLVAGTLMAAEICDLVIDDCVRKLAGTTIAVPSNVVSVSPRIAFCDEIIEKSVGGASRPLSIMIVIDESGSMQATDSGGARLTVPADLLDEIHAFAPSAEVGLVAFSHVLEFDSRDHDYLKPAFPGDTLFRYDAYVPLTPLNKVFPGGRTGLDTMKAFLKVKEDTVLSGSGKIRIIERLLHGRKVPADYMGGATDITLGIDAAKVAFKDSRALPEDRFVIFLSDGETTSGRPNRLDFINGAGMPTTFTVYFTGLSGAVPPSIVAMTDNIKKNGYSVNNPKSAYWGIELPGAELRALIQNHILGRILVMPTEPRQGSVTIGGLPFTSSTAATRHFVFAKRMPLSGELTPLELSFTYTYADTTGGTRITKDTVTRFMFQVRRKDGTALPPGITTSCREQARLSLHHGGAAITAVTDEQAALEIRLVPSPGDGCNGCRVQVLPDAGLDRESIALSPGAGYSTGSFDRALSATPALGDGKLQHTARDSIVLIYQNPDIPLDVVRRGYPFIQIPPEPHPPTLDLFHGGIRLDAVRWDQADLEIRMVFEAGDSCSPCRVQVRPSAGPDRESVALAAAGGYLGGTFPRELKAAALRDDGRLQHGAADSIVLLFIHPARPGAVVRRSYPFLPPPPVFEVSPHNAVARQDGIHPPDGNQWILVAPAGLAVKPLEGKGCCRLLPGPLSPADSMRYAGIAIEASREFEVRIQVFSNLGHFVNAMAIAVPKAEFGKLPPGTRTDTRLLRILWDNRAKNRIAEPCRSFFREFCSQARASGARARLV